MDESRFRQQLEARNKQGKKNEKKHGKNKDTIDQMKYDNINTQLHLNGVNCLSVNKFCHGLIKSFLKDFF